MDLEENGPPGQLSLTPEEVARVRAASARWRQRLKIRHEPLSLTSVGGSDYELSANGVAGFVRLGSLNIEIAPKFLPVASAGSGWRDALWRLLLFGEGLEYLGPRASGTSSANAGLADLLAEVLLNSVAAASVRGYPLGYTSEKQTSQFMRGRLDQSRLQVLVPFRGVVPVVTRRLTRDIPINRLLKWAATELARAVETPHRRKRLLAWTAGLPEVSDVPPHVDRVSRPDRQHEHLSAAFDVAKTLLADRRGAFGDGELDLPGFLWDSEDLFERVVRRLFDVAGRPLGLVATKRAHHLLADHTSGNPRYTSTTPDVDVHAAGVSRLLVDAKYKVLGRDPLSDDVYQVLSGGRVTGVSRVALAYPSSGSGLTVRDYEPVGLGATTDLSTLQLGLEAFATRSGIIHLQEEVRDWMRVVLP